MIKEGYTRVSEIIGWYKSLKLSAIDPIVLKNKCQIGTNVHEAISGSWEGFYVPLDEKEDGYFKSFEKWKQKFNGEVVSQEQRLYCDELKVTGAFDLLIKTKKENLPVIVDFKTSAAEDKIGWPLQGIFYWHLCKVNNIMVAPSCLFIRLDKAGNPPIIYEYEMSSFLWKIAQDCLRVYKVWNV